jgi:hypothetical protein
MQGRIKRGQDLEVVLAGAWLMIFCVEQVQWLLLSIRCIESTGCRLRRHCWYSCLRKKILISLGLICPQNVQKLSGGKEEESNSRIVCSCLLP